MAAIDDIKAAINSLNLLLDSDAYMKMLNDPNTSAQDETLLNSAFSLRNQLTQSLLSVYAANIDQTTPKFAALVTAMTSINTAATAAASTLNAYSDRIKSAVQVASYLDAAIKAAIALGI